MVHGSWFMINGSWLMITYGSGLMVQGMKRQKGISKMKSINMGEQYFKGVLAGYLGVNFMCGFITEWQIDIIKESISHYCEATIAHSQLSYQEKEDQKRQMKQSLEVYIRGVKDEMRAEGRLQL